MCGILGSINIDFSEGHLRHIRHRGPDAQGIYEKVSRNQRVILGHTRLAIVDLSDAGSQPMVSRCGNYAIVFNGEVYNHETLRKEVRDVRFRGHSDTESILYYLIQYGMEGLCRMNGIFAFCFLDLKNGKLVLARDHFGVKPLYYHFENNKLAFCSELRGVQSLVGKREIDIDNLYTYLRLRYNPSPQTLLRKVKKLEPGHYLTIDLEDMETEGPRFYSYKPGAKSDISEVEALEQYDHLLRKAVKRQLMSDVPVSVLLSGGVDSALLTKIAREVSNGNLQAYTAGYREKTEIDEIDEARISAQYLGTPLNEVIIDETDFSEFLPKFISIVEEPLGSQSILPLYYLSEHIHNDGFKVALSGQGVDEPWAGYPKYRAQAGIHRLSGYLGGARILRGLVKHDQYRRAINAVTSVDLVDRFIEIGSVFDRLEMSELMRSSEVVRSGEQAIRALYEKKFGLFKFNQYDPTAALTWFDLRMNLPDDLLLYTDKIAMHHSLEVRVPFLDVELTRFVESLPVRFKVSNNSHKILHKKLAEKYLPREIINRGKKHFATPRRLWFKGKVGKQFEEMILSGDNLFSGLLDKTYIAKLFSDHRRGKVNYEKKLYLLICLHMWIDHFEREQPLPATPVGFQ